ncbi:dTDP-4-amino-4,6-dideoxyglucose formyltransferase [Flavobacterium wongokense]|uniref:dTDP-4-amino-4,6-dideoxyglucose formyltransferase n=1 Tax=Flavobacterium wongokense TaxID=2910674 RepID=UPI001F41EA5D|nr:dTDP-4-amino-4,6-dideoxyglucose formyltransferase [Flavobacterium sp. WG47]MCF6132679.1 dTDP-4-amino-4,6-dideoxyglucose formyltransferase [Flavobacterium sp. WG47]
MFKNALIISDNLPLCQQFFSLIEKKKISTTKFTFSTSPFTNKDSFMVSDKVEVKVYNLKDQNAIDEIIANYDLVFSIHCKQIFPADLVEKVKCINVHPGYNPINRGWYPQVFAIINDYQIGATIHEIDKELDNGHIIARAFVDKEVYDTSESLYNKVIAKEIELLEEHLESILENNYNAFAPESESNLYLKKDFNQLLHLDLSEETTVGKVIDKLRALTHGSYSNAYFIDEKTGKKIYVGIQLKPENDERG